MRDRAGTRLRHSRAVGVARYHLYKDVLLAWPRRHECNICGWRGRRFLTYLHAAVLCPKCGSQVRHRLVAAALAIPAISARLGSTGPDVLHVSPEHCLGLVLRLRARRYVRADYGLMTCDLRQDLTRLPFGNNSFDIVMACDVLEHITDDRRAFAEIHRVLRPRGAAILTVPQSDTARETDEGRPILTPEQRAAAYGQPDHVRNYGSDFEERLREPGLEVVTIDRHAFDEATVARHVLRPPVRLVQPWGWNERRIYFGFKVA